MSTTKKIIGIVTFTAVCMWISTTWPLLTFVVVPVAFLRAFVAMASTDEEKREAGQWF